MDRVQHFISILGVREDEALKALLIISAFAPLQPAALRQNWLRLSTFGHSAPTTKEIWAAFDEADFRCTECGSQLRLTLDHRSGDATDHSPANLQVLCFSCNRGRSRKGSVEKDLSLRVYLAVVDLYEELNRVPTNAEIKERVGVKQIGGASYLVKFLQKRLKAR